jgi:transcriptional regulator with XRE-family HTH domain
MRESELLKELVRAMMRSPLSLDELAAKANVSRSTLNAWIDGKTKGPYIVTMAKVAKALGLTIGFEREQLTLVPEPPTAKPKPRTSAWMWQ